MCPEPGTDADYIASQCDTPADIIRTKLGWYQKKRTRTGRRHGGHGHQGRPQGLVLFGFETERYRPGHLVRGGSQRIPQLAGRPQGAKRTGAEKRMVVRYAATVRDHPCCLQTGQGHDSGRRFHRQYPDRNRVSQFGPHPLSQHPCPVDVLPGC